MRNRRWMVVWGLAGGLLSTGLATGQTTRSAADPTQPPQGLFDETWMSLMLGEQKLGYAHVQQERVGDEIIISNKVYMRVQRAGTDLEVTMHECSRETIAGVPLAFSSVQELAKQPVKVEGEIRNGRIFVTSEQFGAKIVQELDYPAGALMGWSAFLQSLHQKLEPGTKFTLNMFMPTQALNVAVPVTTEVIKREEIELLGEKRSAWRSKVVTTINGLGIEALAWVDDEWRPLRQQVNMMGLTIDMIACDKATALKDIAGAEMFMNTLLPVGRSIDRQQSRRITFEISTTTDQPLPELIETDMQKIRKREAGRVQLVVTRQDHAALAAQHATHQTPAAELAEYLEPTTFINSDDPLVQKLAAEAVGDEKDPWKVADLLRKKVSAVVKYEGLGTGFATAAEVCRNRVGDCTENGILLAALGRARGIPTRVVTGLIYVHDLQNQKDVMGFHMWAQFWINGVWVDLDSAWDQTEADATHLALGTHSTRGAALGSLAADAMLHIGQFKIAVVEVEMAIKE
ncbi:MAG: hypothetical protein HJJLKODD_00817 [Phycisphaerae bacterium]|nr:hypothetical protein [Phycisphaerae bacterium]